MNSSYHRLLLIFLDGVGLAPRSSDNPLSDAPTPTLGRWLNGGGLTSESIGRHGDTSLMALDANLGVDGLPQSATGQTTLFTGVNAARELGQHVPALPGPRLREILDRSNLFSQALARGRAVTFANAYTASYLDLIARGKRRPSATTTAVRAAGLPFRLEEHLRDDRAVSWDITRQEFGERTQLELEPIAPQSAGRHLAALVTRHDLTVFESFLPDLAGHRRFELTAHDVLARIDGLLDGLEEELPHDATVLITSDHGNLEVASSRAHTRNPVPLLVRGPLAPEFLSAKSLADVTPRLIGLLRESH